MDRHGRTLETELKLVEVVFKRRSAPARPLDRQPAGLVDHQRLAVFEQYVDHGSNLAGQSPRTALPNMKPPSRSSSVTSASHPRPASISERRSTPGSRPNSAGGVTNMRSLPSTKTVFTQIGRA